MTERRDNSTRTKARKRALDILYESELRDRPASDTLAERIGLHGVSYFVGWSAWLDIAPQGVNKATALAEVVAGLGCRASDVLAIGDGRNDIEMLTWAGRGVALGDACDEVRQAA